MDILATQIRMVRKDLERLFGAFLPMHLVVSVAVACLFHIQCSLNQGVMDQVWLYPAFHH